MLGERGELWGAHIGLLAAAGFRYPRDRSQCMPRNVLSAMFLSLCVDATALRDGRAVKEYQKPWFRPRPRGSVTTGGSWQPSDRPFQEMTRIQALQAHVSFWPLWNTGPLFGPLQLIYCCFFVLWTGSLSSLRSLFLFWTGCNASVWC